MSNPMSPIPKNEEVRGSGVRRGIVGRRARVKQTGSVGVIEKVIGNCLWLRMADGSSLSGGKGYFQLMKETAAIQSPSTPQAPTPGAQGGK